MTTKTKGKARPYRSGFCGQGNDGASHRRCPGHYRGEECGCSCHAAPAVTTPSAGLRVIDVEQRTDEWYAARCGMVTASAVGALLTPTLKVAANEGSRGLTATLVGERITQHVEPTGITPDMWRGISEEPRAREHYSQFRAGAAECGFMVRTIELEDLPAFEVGYSPDGLVGEDGLIEVKCPRAKGHIQTVLADQVPAYYMPQIQCALLVSGRAWCDYVSWHGGLPMWVKRVEPDPEWQEAIVAAVAATEARITEMVRAYAQATDGMPATERAVMEMVI